VSRFSNEIDQIGAFTGFSRWRSEPCAIGRKLSSIVVAVRISPKKEPERFRVIATGQCANVMGDSEPSFVSCQVSNPPLPISSNAINPNVSFARSILSV
jgi:hypothetical protein